MNYQERIPKVIHYCWFGKKEKNELVKKCIDSWKKNLPDFNIIEWNEDNYDITKNDFIKYAYQNEKWAFVSDFVRLDVLYQHGGIYLDTDVEVRKSFDPFLNHSFFTCFETGIENENYLVSTAVLGSIKSNKVISDFLNIYRNMDSEQYVNFKTPNTQILTKLLVENYGLNIKDEKQLPKDNICVYPSDYFCAKNWATKKLVITKNTHAIHHFDGSWKGFKDKVGILIMGKVRDFFGIDLYTVIKKFKKRTG
ncbi:MAG: glycosyltransferase [Heyndrickxia coagulans]|jgi:mannosyltransferase OCH1-like enzyme|uniref:glycosyltransferase family 32 protein n=1 Tax=Heyndrickxia coagulans TaxID=1398 RepID=UPI0004097ED0|nr:glycosyltransferase [Heyndrickxia coagulans]